MHEIVNRMPGVGSEKTAAFRNVWISREGRRTLPGLRIIDGSKSRDPGNTGDVDVLRAGLLMGKITASGKYASSVLGLTAEAIDSTETAVDIPAAVVTELQRRVGATGTFKITGPATAGGVVRTLTAAYSGFADADTVTITALGVNEVQKVLYDDTLSGGNISLTATDKDGKVRTVSVGWDTNWATTLTALAAAINAVLGTDAVALANLAAAEAGKGFSVTFGGADYAALPQPLVSSDISELAKGSSVQIAVATVSRTTAGVDGRFVTGSLIQPTDGSETPVAILDKADGEKVTDDDGTNLDIQAKDLVIGGGLLDASQVVNWPADASTQAWIKTQLRAAGGPWTFDDNY